MGKTTEDDLDRAVQACLEPKSDEHLVKLLNKALKVAKRLPKPPLPDTPLNIAAKRRLAELRSQRQQ